MANRTPTQDKALAWWCEKEGLILQMSTHPKYFFKNKGTGEITTRLLEPLTFEYKAFIKDQKKSQKKRGEG